MWRGACVEPRPAVPSSRQSPTTAFPSGWTGGGKPSGGVALPVTAHAGAGDAHGGLVGRGRSALPSASGKVAVAVARVISGSRRSHRPVAVCAGARRPAGASTPVRSHRSVVLPGWSAAPAPTRLKGLSSLRCAAWRGAGRVAVWELHCRSLDENFEALDKVDLQPTDLQTWLSNQTAQPHLRCSYVWTRHVSCGRLRLERSASAVLRAHDDGELRKRATERGRDWGSRLAVMWVVYKHVPAWNRGQSIPTWVFLLWSVLRCYCPSRSSLGSSCCEPSQPAVTFVAGR